MQEQWYRIFNLDGDEHVATVREADVEETLAFYNERRPLDVDGNVIGQYHAEPYDGYVAGGR